MKNHPGVPDLSDTALDDHISDLQSKLDQLTISLELATAEKTRRAEQDSQTYHRAVKKEPNSTLPSTSSLTPTFRIGSKVKILNKYKGNKGRIGTIIDLSHRTATVSIPNKGNFIKHLNSLELVSDHDEK